MCMKYLNATVNCFENVIYRTNSSLPYAYERPFDGVIAVKENGEYYLNSFGIVTSLCLLGTNKEDCKKDNLLSQRGKLDVIIRLTKCDKDPEKRIGLDIDEFQIDCKEKEEDICVACYDFLNYTRITKTNRIKLDAGKGKYVIKVLVKDHKDSIYTVQSMFMLIIKYPE